MSSPSGVHLSAHALGLTLPGGRVLFRDLSLAFGPERTALVGPNGIGKTLLLEVLVGLRAPSAGHVVRAGRVGYVPQRAPRPDVDGLSPTVASLMGIDERLARVRRVLDGEAEPHEVDVVGEDWDLEERARALLDRLGLEGVEMGRPVGSLSGGEETRVRLARPVLSSPDLLVLDEPTNDLDGASRRALAAFLEEWTGGLLVVSHDRTLLEGVDRIVELNTLGAREYGGGWALYREVRERERTAAREELEQARTARRRTRAQAQEARERRERRAARGRRARGDGSQPPVVLEGRRERSEGTARRGGEEAARQAASAGERVARARARVEERAELRLELEASGLPSRKEILRVEEVRWSVPGGGPVVLDGISLRVRGPERVAVTGPNGAGKSTLLGLLTGRLVPEAGRVEVGVEAGRVAFLDQSVALLGSGRTVLEAFRAAHPDMELSRARHALARFLFEGEAAMAPVKSLSGGERMRAGLACALGGPRTPWLLLLDEPTNHLDLESLDTLEEAVAAYDGALVVVSHDPRFLEAVGVERTVALG